MCCSTCDSLPRAQRPEAEVIITRRIRTLRMLVRASFPSMICCRAHSQLGPMALAVAHILCQLASDGEVFMLPEGYRHDIQHKNQPLASYGATIRISRIRSLGWASIVLGRLPCCMITIRRRTQGSLKNLECRRPF